MVGVGVYANKNPKLATYLTCEYNWQISKVLTLSTGGRFAYTRIDESWTVGQNVYSFDENIFKINSVSSVKLNVPLYKSFGIESSAQFLFEPIPLGIATLDNYSNNKTDSETKYIFTKFNPGYLLNIGIYNDFLHNNKKARFSLGFGYGWCDMYKDYRIAKFNTETHVRANTPCYNIYFNTTLF